MKSIMKVSRQMAAPPEAVFELASDFPNAATRISGITKVEMLTEGPVGLGTRFKETRVMLGKEASEVMEVTAFEPGRFYTLGASSCGMEYKTDLRFEPEGDGTRVTMEMQGRPLNLMSRIMGAVMSPLLKGTMKTCVTKDLDDLAKLAEGGGKL